MLNSYVSMIYALAITASTTAKPLSNEETPSLKPYLNKKYKLTSSDDNFEKIMKALGVGFVKRKVILIATPVMELAEKDGEYTLSSESTFKNTYLKFRLNQEFKEITPDDRVVKTIFTQDKNKLIQVQRGKGKTTKTTREFTPEKVTVTAEVDGIVSVRIYSAV